MSVFRVFTLGINVLHVPGSSDEGETTQDEVSSHTSEEDGSMVKVKKELENAEQPVAGTPRTRENEASVYWLCTQPYPPRDRRVLPNISSPHHGFLSSSPTHLLQMPLGRRKGHKEFLGCQEQEILGTICHSPGYPG